MSIRGTTVTERRDMAIVALSGSVDVYTAPAVESELDLIDAGARQVVVDLSRVTLIDSAGMRALVRLRNRARHANRSIGIVCPRLQLRRIMEVAGLVDGFVVGDDLEAIEPALARLHGAAQPALASVG